MQPLGEEMDEVMVPRLGGLYNHGKGDGEMMIKGGGENGR